MVMPGMADGKWQIYEQYCDSRSGVGDGSDGAPATGWTDDLEGDRKAGRGSRRERDSAAGEGSGAGLVTQARKRVDGGREMGLIADSR